MSRFRNEQDIALRTSIPGIHRSLVSTERRRRYFKDITLQINDKGDRQIRPVDRREIGALSTLRLIPQVGICADLTPRRRVSGRSPKMPIGSAGNPFFAILRIKMIPNNKDTSSACESERNPKRHFRQRPPRKYNPTSIRRVRDMEAGESFLRQAVYYYRNYGRNKADFKWKRPGVVIGRVMAKTRSGLSQRGVDLNDLAHADKIRDVLGRDGTLHLHLNDKKSTIRNLADPQSLVILAHIRNAIPPTNKTTWGNTDTRLYRNLFFKENPDRRIPIDELGVGGGVRLKNFLNIYIYRNGARWPITEKIQGLDDVMTRQPIDHKRRALDGRILKLLFWRGRQLPNRELKLRK